MNRPVYAILAVAAIAGALRFARLSFPTDYVFDEVYYPKAGCILIGGTNAQCDVQSSDEKFWRTDKWDVGSWVHPPMGKWMIGLGEKAFGFGSFGRRFSAALVGTLSCVLLAGIAQILWGRALWTFVAGLLLATESLNFVQSRTAMLDIFVTFWIVLGFLFLVLDRRWIDRRTPPVEEDPPEDAPRPEVPSPLWRPWRYAAGVALGASVATKWSGITALAAAVILSVAWEAVRRKRDGRSMWGGLAWAIAREGLGIVIAFLLLPVVVYVAIYLPWFNHFGWSATDWWKNQQAMWDYNMNLKSTALDTKTHTYTPIHAYLSPAWQWIYMQRPVLYYAKYTGDTRRVIYAIGNPVIFWGSTFTLPYVGWMWRRARDWRAGLVLVAFLVQYLPWLKVTRPQFFFYATPLSPFMVLAGVYACVHLSEARLVLRDPVTGDQYESVRHPYRPFAWAYVIGAVALFVWFYPVLTGLPLTTFWFRARMWFSPGWI
jgi:dolichyl-phosphate-mannose-protein mannosyltransferase